MIGANGPQILPAHLEYLRGEGLLDATIDMAGITSVTDPEVMRAELRWETIGPKPPVPALRFSYPGTDYVRYRPDSPRVERHRDRKVKYEAPRGIPPRIYVPRDVNSAIGDPAEPLYLLEGEKKALVANQLGMAAAAAPGVNTFHQKRERQSDEGPVLHGDLGALVPRGRKTVILFDSDIDANPNVMNAAVRLASMLRAVGSDSCIAFLDSDRGQKLGLDDAYNRGGRDGQALRARVVDATRPTDPQANLVEWLAKRWRAWSLERQQLELNRAIPFACQQDPDQKAMWVNEAARLLGRKVRDLKALLKTTTFARHSQNADDEDDSDGWMGAPGFFIVADGPRAGLWKNHESKDPTPITSAPINIVAIGIAEDQTVYSAVRFKHRDREVVRRVPRLQLSSPEIIELAAHGAPVQQANRPVVQMFLQRQEQFHKHRIPEVQVFTKPGWTRDLGSYVFGRKVIGSEGWPILETGDKVLDAQEARGRIESYLDLCREARRKSPVARVFWAAGYAGPILRLIGRRSFALSVWSNSGGGKSAAQALAVSPWGRPEGLKITGDATSTAMEAALAQYRDNVLWIDDTQQTRNQQILDLLAYQVGGETGRARGTAGGGMQAIRDWVVVATISGEHPLLRAGSAKGARNRTVEFREVPFASPEFAASLHRELAQHHGHTGPSFIQGLIDRYIRPSETFRLRKTFDEFARDLADRPDETTLHIAALCLADYLAQTIVLGEPAEVAHAAALTTGREIRALARNAPDSAVDPVDAGYDAILGLISENELALEGGSQRRIGAFIEPDKVDPRESKGRRVVAIMRGPLVELARKHEFNVEEVMAGLRDRGDLIPGDSNHMTRHTSELGPQRPRAYWIVLPYAAASAETKPAQPPSPATPVKKRRSVADIVVPPKSPAAHASNPTAPGESGSDERGGLRADPADGTSGPAGTPHSSGTSHGGDGGAEGGGTNG
ncbi:MAG: DUF927 domain-containing protein [Deltaproteobacteria bacterium]|nr:DUF927 domain-containing protein [Deltaproteobacteria bacterium]